MSIEMFNRHQTPRRPDPILPMKKAPSPWWPMFGTGFVIGMLLAILGFGIVVDVLKVW